MDLVVLDNEIFWITHKSNRLNWANKNRYIPENKGKNLRKYDTNIIIILLFLELQRKKKKTILIVYCLYSFVDY
jgi:hypothetical protein